MPYIGRDLNRGNYLKLDDISSSFDSSTTTFNLTVGGSAFTPGSAFSILVSVGGVIQEPESAYQVNNSEITFANAPTAQDSFFCIALGVALGIGVPGNGTVNGTQLAKPFSYDGYFDLDSTNNRVGINSSTPTVALDVIGDIKLNGNLVTGGGGGNFGIVTCTGLDVNGNGDVSGNFVIGGDLTVNGTTTTLDTNLTEVDRVEVGANSNTLAGIAVTQSGSADLVQLYDGASQVVTIDDEGKVGIGSVIPAEKLDVSGKIKVGSNGVILSGDDAYSGGYPLKVTTSYGYVNVGPYNASYAHFVTDRGRFYFNKKIIIDEGVISSYDENLVLATNAGNDEHVHITTSGKVGIGTDNPDSLLHVAGSGIPTIKLQDTDTVGGYAHFEVNGSALFIESYDEDGTEGQILFKNATSESMRIKADGKVGINTTTPDTFLEVFGGSSSIQVGNQSGSGRFGADGTSTKIGSHSNHNLDLFTNGVANTRIRITSDGAVGINSTTPTTGYKLDVNGDLSLGEKNGTDNTFIDQKQDGDFHIINSGRTSNGGSGTPGTAGVGINRYNTLAGGTTYHRDFTVYNGKDSKVLVVDGSASAVGIGTDNPRNSSKLDVLSTTSNGVFINYDGQSNTEYGLRIESNASGGNFESDFVNGTTALLDLYANSSTVTGGDLLVARTQSSTPIFLVKGNGKVGINSTSPSHTLDVVGGYQALGLYRDDFTGNSGAGIEFNFGRAKANGDLFNCATVTAVGSDNTGQAGQLRFSVLDSGSMDEKLRIDSSGTVNIGGDYTSTTSRLQINSTSYPETTEYLAVFKAGVANGNRFKNRYIKIRNNYTGSVHGGVPIVWESNADGSNNKAYGAVVTEGNGDIRFLNAAATSEKAIGTDLLNTISERLRIRSDGNVDINGTPPWTISGGNFRNLSISGEGASASGFLWLGNGAATNNADFDLGRINFLNGGTIVARVIGTTDTSANDDGVLRFNTKKTGETEAERLRIDSSGRVLIGGGSSPSSVGDGQLIVYSSDRLHPAIRGAGTSSNHANGWTLLSDNYTATESQLNLGVSYSGSGVVLSRGVKVSGSADDTYLSSQANYSTRPSAFKLDDDGSFVFLNTSTNATTTVDSAVTLYERLRITSGGQVNLGGATQTTHLLYLQSTGDAGIHIRADSDNSGENDNPYLSMSQDGSNNQELKIGQNGDAGQNFSESLANSPFIHANHSSAYPLQLAHMDTMVVNIANRKNELGLNDYSGNTVAGMEIHHRGNDTAVALKFTGHNNSGGTPGNETFTQFTHLGANAEFYIHHLGNTAIKIGSTRRIDCPAVYGTAISSPMRDLYIESTGQMGYNPSVRASKINIADNNDVSWLYNLTPKTYNKRKRVCQETNEWTNEAESDLQYGLIAEEVELVNSNICFYDVDDFNNKTLAGVTYSQLITPLLKAIQEQKAEIDALKKRLDDAGL